MPKPTQRMDGKGRSCYQIYQEIARRQVGALMFHTKSADLFDFLNLHGFKKIHEYQYFAESKEHRNTKKYFINHHNMLLMELKPKEPQDVIPDEWSKYSRMDVNPQTRRQAVEKALTTYYEWECETLECYEDYSKSLMDMGAIADSIMVNKLIEDVSRELKKITRLVLKLKSTSYDDVYIVEMQCKLHDKYKKKME